MSEYITEATKATEIRYFMFAGIIEQKDPAIVKANLKKLRKDVKAFAKYVRQQRDI